MAWRFKASKYRNAVPIVPKLEQLNRDLSIGSYRSHGHFIAASAAFMAFNWDTQGSNLAVLPLSAKGIRNKADVPLIYAHADFVTDFAFSPFDDGLLATASQDTTIKLWRIPEAGLTSAGLSEAELVLPAQPRRVETVTFHTTSDTILTTSWANTLVMWDMVSAKELYSYSDHEEEIQSLSWQPMGAALATQCKDKTLRILDPRQNSLAASSPSHQGITDSKVTWLGDSQRLLTSGFGADRLREIFIRDMRMLSSPLKHLSLDLSSGILIPLMDVDTNMCFLAGKGDRNIQFVEIADKEPFIIEGLKYSGDQTKGACLVPKRAMDVMQAEVNRVLQLCDSSVVPITWQVPRKSYREYHADIFPRTAGMDAAVSAQEWWSGQDVAVAKIDLDPKNRPSESLTVFRKCIAHYKAPASVSASNGHGPDESQAAPVKPDKPKTVCSPLPSASPSVTTGCNNIAFVKPCPRPRASISNHKTAPAAPATAPVKSAVPVDRVVANSSCHESGQVSKEWRASASPSPCASPRLIKPTNQNSHLDQTEDDSLAMLRRQPSIRDRKKLFEDQVRKSQECQPPSRKSSVTSSKEQPASNDQDQGCALRKKSLPETDRKSNGSCPVSVKKSANKVFVRVSKFKHLKGDVILKSKFENLKNLSKTMPAECNFVQANAERIALPLSGPGGKLAILEMSKPGRIPDGVTPVLINGASVMDFAFDPFHHGRLLAACDDGQVRIWIIPEGGLQAPTSIPSQLFSAHSEKLNLIKFHPLTENIFMTAAFDRLVKIWHLTDELVDSPQPVFTLMGHTEQLFSAEWSTCGRYLATVCKDGKIRIYEPKTSGQVEPLIEGGQVIPKKGARLVWVLHNQYLVVTAFTRQSERLVSLYSAKNLDLVTSITLEVSPTILRTFYDEDSSTLFLTGKGENVITPFEVSLEPPHFFALSVYRAAGLHQGLAFLAKNVCDVRSVEFARAIRVTDHTIEPISFTVPRVRTSYFQDDLFPPTKVLWQPTMTAQEWLNGVRREAKTVSLQPDNMEALTESCRSSVSSASASGGHSSLRFSSQSSFDHQEAHQKAKHLQESVSKMLNFDSRLEQDDMEGVNQEEWDEEP